MSATTLSDAVPKMVATTSDCGIPENWERVTIATLIERGATIRTGPFGTLLKAAEYSVDGAPVVSVGEIGTGSVNITDDTPRVPVEVTKRLPAYLLRAGDIVFGRKGAVDRSALIRADQDGWFLGSDGIRLRLPKTVVPEYAIYQLQRREARDWLASNSVGTTMASLNQEIIGRVPILIAPKIEQRAVAAALSDVDVLIEALDELIAKNRAIRLATSQQLLAGQTRLPGFGKPVGIIKTEIGLIPRDWEIRRLGDIGQCFIGLTFTPDKVVSDGLFVLRASNIGENGLRFEDKLCVDMSVPEKLLLKEGDLLICVRNGSRSLIGKCCLVDSRANGMTFGAFMSVFRSARNRFVFHYFQSEAMKRQIHEHLGATINQITNKSLTSFRIALPSIAEQDAIADVLSDCETEIDALERRRDKTKAIKQGMMQVLLTGKVRLV